jgi:transposase
MSAVAVTRLDLDASGLRRAAALSKEAAAARRMLALALVLDGALREEAAVSCGMDRQTLRDWVHRYNAEGVAGLSNKRPPGAAPRLTAEQSARVAQWVRAGPNLAADGVVRWRRVDLAAKIAREFGVVLAERSVGDLLHRLGFRRISVRPQHPDQDAAALEAHKKTSPNWSVLPFRSTPAASRWKSGGRTRPGSVSKAR